MSKTNHWWLRTNNAGSETTPSLLEALAKP
jgi:hypothetical protein